MGGNIVEKILFYVLLSALGLLICKMFYKLYRKILSFFVQEEVKNNRKRLVEHINALYEEMKNYSICLSLDYKRNGKYKNENKEVLNKVIYSEIKKTISKIPNIRISNTGDILVIVSCDFSSYDRVYSSILKLLSRINSKIKKNYNLVLIPSIVSDAHAKYPDISSLARDYSNIKHCNFVNQSCSTKVFSKKYILANKSRYAGVPVGEYSILDNDKEVTYDLNLVNKNLSLALANMG